MIFILVAQVQKDGIDLSSEVRNLITNVSLTAVVIESVL